MKSWESARKIENVFHGVVETYTKSVRAGFRLPNYTAEMQDLSENYRSPNASRQLFKY